MTVACVYCIESLHKEMASYTNYWIKSKVINIWHALVIIHNELYLECDYKFLKTDNERRERMQFEF